MKAAVNIARILVGLLFIFSGLVKANDPHGLEYKMYEFFETWGWHQNYASLSGLKFFPHLIGSLEVWMIRHTLIISVLMNAFEIIAGFAILLGWRARLFTWLLLLLILFFTFLTGYTYVTGKPTNCGCFGDCLPISSKTSFLKDVALTLLIGFLFWKYLLIGPLLTVKASALAMIAAVLFSFGFQWYTLNYLPIVDCLPFKKKNNITKQMQKPENAIDPVIAITFVYEKNGKQKEYNVNNLPADLDSTYKLVKRYDKVVVEGSNYQPPIHGFVLSGSTDEDSTNIVLSQPYAILLFCQDFNESVNNWKAEFEKLYSEAKAKNIPAYAITTQLDEAQRIFSGTGFKDIPIFKCDVTAIRMAARANPCVYLISKGTIIDKQGDKRMDKLISEIQNLPATPAMDNNQPAETDSTGQH